MATNLDWIATPYIPAWRSRATMESVMPDSTIIPPVSGPSRRTFAERNAASAGKRDLSCAKRQVTIWVQYYRKQMHQIDRFFTLVCLDADSQTSRIYQGYIKDVLRL